MVYVAIAAALGGILAALVGWLDSHDPFDARKFAKSVVAAGLSAIGLAVLYSASDTVTARDLFLALLAGAGVDAGANRVLGAIKRTP